MPQILIKRLVRKLSRRQLLIAATVIVTGAVVWSFSRGTSRSVEETSWDNIVFSEMSHSPNTSDSPDPDPRSTAAPRAIARPLEFASQDMNVEIAANAPLILNVGSTPDPARDSRSDEFARGTEPTWFGGEIEAVESTVR